MTTTPLESESSTITDAAAAQDPGDLYFCTPSFAQERLWFLNQLDPDSSAYNVALTFHVRGRLQIGILEKALSAIVSRHEVLRGHFRIVGGELAQIISPSIEVMEPVEDLQSIAEDERLSFVEQLLTEEVKKPFDLQAGPLFRAKLWRLAADEYAFMLNMHHSAADGWSFNILRDELAAQYEAIRTETTPDLPELTIQYGDYAAWQREWLQGETLEHQFQYWKHQLGNRPPVQDMPTDHPRPPLRTSRGAVQRVPLPNPVKDKLKLLCQKEGCTPFMAFLAAYQILLHRYSGQTDIWVGTPVAGRTQAEIEPLIGCFINTLVLRTDLGGDPTFRELLYRVRDTALAAYAHQDMPFEVLVERLQVPRDRSRNPLFQAMFIDSSSFIQPLELPGLRFDPLLIERGAAMMDLTLFLVGSREGLRIGIEYSTDLFNHETITRMHGHFQRLLEGIVADPDQRISALLMLTGAERHQMLVEWNATRQDYRSSHCVHELFEEQADRSPDNVAVVFEQQQLTYQELNQRANRLAHFLQSRGVKSGALVGICMDRSLEMMVALLAVLKCGAAYVPLDPEYPRDRIAFMIEDARTLLILTHSSLVGSLPQGATSLCSIDTESSLIQECSEANLPPTAQVGDRAYAIYTSGSTGKPKGVQIPHRALVNFLESMRQSPGIAPDDVLLAVTTLSFDIAGLELFLPLLVGARVVLVPREKASDGVGLSTLLHQSQATIMQATPATWRLLLEADWQGKPDLKILCGGEAMPVDLAKELLPRCASLWNMYGPTETTIWSTLHRVVRAETPIPIGRPIANTTVYILDDRGEPVRIGAPGELYIGGDGVSSGYLDRQELTAEKFVPDPFSGTAEARLFRTGDLARYLPDGTIECLGRLDHQVKLRGFRIELGEIEAALGEHPEVQQVAVVAREDAPGNKRLVAFLVSEEAPAATNLRSFLKERLPDYMIPSLFVSLESFPLTPNGKVDRKALPDPDFSSAERETEYTAPRDMIEIQMARIWQEILGSQEIGIHDSFFDLGGHSLLAVRLFARIEKTFNRQLPLATLFRAPTIAQVCDLLRSEPGVNQFPALVPIQPRGSKPPLFCLHRDDGIVMCYRELANCLGPDQPVYGLQAEGLTGEESFYSRAEEMAAHYVAEIRSFYPQGPYYLAGSSFGGILAYEVAQQLQGLGGQVRLLALLDTFAPVAIQRGLNELPVLRRLPVHLQALKQLGVKDKLDYIASRMKGKVQQALHDPAPEFDSELAEHLPETLRQIQIASWQAYNDYQPQIYRGRITLFRAQERNPFAKDDPELWWGGMSTQGLEIRDVPGNHLSMLKAPYVQFLAEELSLCLRSARPAE